MNKTVMQDYLEIHRYKLDSAFCKFWLQKEREFAFDCYYDGHVQGLSGLDTDFDQFYSKYTDETV